MWGYGCAVILGRAGKGVWCGDCLVCEVFNQYLWNMGELMNEVWKTPAFKRKPSPSDIQMSLGCAGVIISTATPIPFSSLTATRPSVPTWLITGAIFTPGVVGR